MAGSVNKVILVGVLGRDPDIRTTQSGDKIANISLATSDSWTDRASGERKEKTEWHRVVIFDPGIADIAEKYLKKGAKVYLEGALATRKYEQNGVEKFTTEVTVPRFRGVLTMMDKAPGNGGGSDRGTSTGGGSWGGGNNVEDDNIPF